MDLAIPRAKGLPPSSVTWMAMSMSIDAVELARIGVDFAVILGVLDDVVADHGQWAPASSTGRTRSCAP